MRAEARASALSKPLVKPNPYGSLRRAGAAVADDRAMLNGGYGLMEVKCHRRSIPLDAVRSRRAIR
jgi:hypothetical protein